MINVYCQEKSLTLPEMRLIKGYSQQVVADLMGVQQRTISDWELGKYLPRDDKIERLAEVLEVDPDNLKTLVKARYYAKQLKELGCSVDDYEYLYDQVA